MHTQTLSQFNSLQSDTAFYNLKLSAKDCNCTFFLSASFLPLSTKQPDVSLLFWSAGSSSVCVYSLQCILAGCGAGKVVVWLVEGAQWNMNLAQVQERRCGVISFLPTTNQVKVTHASDLSTSFWTWITGLHILLLNHRYTAARLFLCHLVRTAFVSVWLQGQHSGSVLQLLGLNECSQISGTLNIFRVAAQHSFT